MLPKSKSQRARTVNAELVMNAKKMGAGTSDKKVFFWQGFWHRLKQAP